MSEKPSAGRPPESGETYTIYFRYRPERDPPELKELLDRIMAARGEERAILFRNALLDGLTSNNDPTPEPDDDGVVSAILDELF